MAVKLMEVNRSQGIRTAHVEAGGERGNNRGKVIKIQMLKLCLSEDKNGAGLSKRLRNCFAKMECCPGKRYRAFA